MPADTDPVAFSDLRTAAYCPRKCYYVRRDDRTVPADVLERRDLAFRYPRLVEAPDALLADCPLAVSPDRYRENLATLRSEHPDLWEALTDPADREALLSGKDCRGIAHKVLSDPPRPSLVSTGDPPENGVWEPQSVHAVAAAKALAWERERPVERAVVEYPTHGVVRTVELTTRRKATYRRVLRTVRSIDGPPPRLDDDAKCDACEYADECGVRTRTLRSLIGG